MAAMAVTAVVAAGVLAGCGNKEDDTAKTKAQTEESAESQKEESAVSKSAGKDASEENVQAEEEEQQDTGTDNSQAETAQADAQADNTAEASEKNEIFGEFKTKTLDGEEVDQDIFAKADLTMVNIWGTFCGPCIREMPELGELSREYADKGFQMVGIISDVSQPEDDTALEIVKKTEADYTHLVIPKDANMQYRILKNAQVVPTTIFLDKDGNQVGDTYPGAKSKKQWTAVIDEMLEKVQNE